MALTQISTAGVKDDAVTSGKIPANAVGSSELADNAVDTAAIADDAVTADKIANSINTAIAANTAKNTNATHTGDVTGSGSLTIASNAVTTAKIADSAITNNKLQDNSIVSGKLADSGVNSGSYGSATAIPAITVNNKGQITAASTNNVNIPAGTTINNNADNKVITGSGTANTLNGESGLTYNGSTLGVSGSVAVTGGSLSLDGHPLVGTANFTDISGGSYSARLGSTGSSTIRSTQIYGGGGHIATFDGVNVRLGIGLTNPSQKLHLKDTAPMAQIESSSYSSFVGTAEANDNIGNGTKAGNLVLRGQTGKAISGNGGTATQVKIDADGLKFGTDTAAANALDDYEEGSWTPNLQDAASGGNSHGNSGVRQATYVKVGRNVTVMITARSLSNSGMNGSHQMFITNLPFRMSGVEFISVFCQLQYFNNVSNTQFGTHWKINNNTTVMKLEKMADNAGANPIVAWNHWQHSAGYFGLSTSFSYETDQ